VRAGIHLEGLTRDSKSKDDEEEGGRRKTKGGRTSVGAGVAPLRRRDLACLEELVQTQLRHREQKERERERESFRR
jgi:hypothetical protein